jgi:hypothetical protein
MAITPISIAKIIQPPIGASKKVTLCRVCGILYPVGQRCDFGMVTGPIVAYTRLGQPSLTTEAVAVDLPNLVSRVGFEPPGVISLPGKRSR